MGISYNRNFICVFCKERVRSENVYIKTGDICICRACYGALVKNTPAMPFEGVGDVSYVMSPFEYGGALRDTIIDFKFNDSYAYAELYAEMIKDYLLSYDIWQDFDCIVPVPLHRGRMRQRGYNQSELIARYVSKYIGLPLRADLVSRGRATEKQSSLKGMDRVSNVRGAFKCGSDVKGKRIVLFDDIFTTGSTLRACAEPLKAAGAESICAVTLAMHAQNKLPWEDRLNANMR